MLKQFIQLINISRNQISSVTKTDNKIVGSSRNIKVVFGFRHSLSFRFVVSKYLTLQYDGRLYLMSFHILVEIWATDRNNAFLYNLKNLSYLTHWLNIRYDYDYRKKCVLAWTRKKPCLQYKLKKALSQGNILYKKIWPSAGWCSYYVALQQGFCRRAMNDCRRCIS